MTNFEYLASKHVRMSDIHVETKRREDEFGKWVCASYILGEDTVIAGTAWVREEDDKEFKSMQELNKWHHFLQNTFVRWLDTECVEEYL